MDPLFGAGGGSARAAIVLRLHHDGVAPLEALGRLAAFHVGTVGVRGFRTAHVAAGVQHFPAPEDVPLLLGALVEAIRRLFEDARDVQDELRAAGFVLWGLTAIHPFDDGNGRTALDFTQLVLVQRWNTKAPPLRDDGRLDHRLAPIFRAIEPRNDGSVHGFVAQRAELLRVFSSVTPAALAAHEPFDDLGRALAAQL